MCIFNHIPLLVQVGQRRCANLFRFKGDALTLPQSVATPAKSLSAGQKLLALLELQVTRACFWVIRVSISKELFAVRVRQ